MMRNISGHSAKLATLLLIGVVSLSLSANLALANRLTEKLGRATYKIADSLQSNQRRCNPYEPCYKQCQASQCRRPGQAPLGSAIINSVNVYPTDGPAARGYNQQAHLNGHYQRQPHLNDRYQHNNQYEHKLEDDMELAKELGKQIGKDTLSAAQVAADALNAKLRRAKTGLVSGEFADKLKHKLDDAIPNVVDYIENHDHHHNRDHGFRNGHGQHDHVYGFEHEHGNQLGYVNSIGGGEQEIDRLANLEGQFDARGQAGVGASYQAGYDNQAELDGINAGSGLGGLEADASFTNQVEYDAQAGRMGAGHRDRYGRIKYDNQINYDNREGRDRAYRGRDGRQISANYEHGGHVDRRGHASGRGRYEDDRYGAHYANQLGHSRRRGYNDGRAGYGGQVDLGNHNGGYVNHGGHVDVHGSVGAGYESSPRREGGRAGNWGDHTSSGSHHGKHLGLDLDLDVDVDVDLDINGLGHHSRGRHGPEHDNRRFASQHYNSAGRHHDSGAGFSPSHGSGHHSQARVSGGGGVYGGAHGGAYGGVEGAIHGGAYNGAHGGVYGGVHGDISGQYGANGNNGLEFQGGYEVDGRFGGQRSGRFGVRDALSGYAQRHLVAPTCASGCGEPGQRRRALGKLKRGLKSIYA